MSHVRIRKRDRDFSTPVPKALPVEPPRVVETDARIDDVLAQLDKIAKRPQPKLKLADVEKLTTEIAALRVSRELPWEFDIIRDSSNRIKKVTATQVRPRLI